jgi:hypothetical protein
MDDEWSGFNVNLDVGHMTFLKEDSTSLPPLERLFCGTLGNGAYIHESSGRGTNPPSIALAKVEQPQPSLHGVQSSNRPGSGTPSIRFAVGASLPVTVSIYSSTGRLVRLLTKEQVYAEGDHIVTWDGVDDSGHRAPSGVYYARVSTPIKSETTKLLMVR